MKPKDAIEPPTEASAQTERFFTVDSANAALIFVRKVVEDVVHAYQDLMGLRSRREELALLNGTAEQVTALQRRIERLVARLNDLHTELSEVGCQLKDWSSGLVDFPAQRDGRRVDLCWKLGEQAVRHWHEVDAGFAGRQPIDDGFDKPPAVQHE